MVQRLAQMPRGMQHVGCDQQVISVAFESLFFWIDFDIQHAVVDRGFLSSKA